MALPQMTSSASAPSGSLAANVGRKVAASSRDDRDAVIADLQRQIHEERDKNRSLQDQYKVRVATFVKRELQTKSRIEALERRLAEKKESDEHDHKMLYVQSMHRDVIKSLDHIQNSTAQKLQDQERDLLKAFNAKLQKVKAEMRNSDNKQGAESLESKLSFQKVVDDLRQAQEMAQNFDKENLQLQAENQKLSERLRNRDDDREALKRELVMARKEAARLKAMAMVRDGSAGASRRARSPAGPMSEDEAEPPKQQFSLRQLEEARMQQTHNKQYEREMRYREAEQRLKRLAGHEKTTNDALRKQEVSMLQQRTELESLLRQCLDDVKAEVMRRRSDSKRPGPLPSGAEASAAGTGPPICSISVHDLDAKDRERVLELLLSQQRAVQLLYQSPGSISPGAASSGGARSSHEAHASTLGFASRHDRGSPGQEEDEFAWLSRVPT